MKKSIMLFTALIVISANFAKAQSSQVVAIKQEIEKRLSIGDSTSFITVKNPEFSLYDFAKLIYLQDADTTYNVSAVVIAKEIYELNVNKGYRGGKTILFGDSPNEDIILPLLTEQIGFYDSPIKYPQKYKASVMD